MLLSVCCFSQNTTDIQKLNKQFADTIQKDFVVSRNLAYKAVVGSEALNDPSLTLESYSNLSLIYYQQKKNDSSFIYTNKALDLAKKLKNKKQLTILLNRYGALERRKGDYSNALTYYQRAIEIAKSENYAAEICDVYNNMASIYRIRKDKEKSIEMLENAILTAKKHYLPNQLAVSYNIKGISFFSTHKDSTIYYYKKALELSKAAGNRHYQGVVYSNLGDIYVNIERFQEAREHLELAEVIAESVNDFTTLYFINIVLGNFYFDQKNYEESVKKYEKAIYKYGKYVDDTKITHGYWLISEGYYLNNQLKKAYKAQEKYMALNEEITSAKKAKEFDEIRTQYEVKEKDNQIALLEKENELAKSKRQALLIIGLLVTLTLILLILYYRNRIRTQKILRQKENERLKKEQEILQVKAQISGQDKERHRLAKELHDGLGGQLAGVNLKLSQLNSDLKNPDINKVSDKLSHIFKDLRILSHNLSANYFHSKSFDKLLYHLKDQYEASGEYQVSISVFPDQCVDDVNLDIKHNLYRILQELFSNTLKHSRCNNVELSINRHENTLVVIYEDDGIGFNTEDVKAGIGLSNITERAKSINSDLKIDSHQGKGTQIMLQIPV